jgi:hypothetical protein
MGFNFIRPFIRYTKSTNSLAGGAGAPHFVEPPFFKILRSDFLGSAFYHFTFCISASKLLASYSASLGEHCAQIFAWFCYMMTQEGGVGWARAQKLKGKAIVNESRAGSIDYGGEYLSKIHELNCEHVV